MLQVRQFAAAILLLSWILPLQASVFPRPPELEPAVRFWRDVFVNYSEHQVVLHDRANTHIVYKVLDFSDVVPLLSEEELWLHMRKIEQEEKAALREHMLGMVEKIRAGAMLDAEEQRLSHILQAYGAFNEQRILEAADQLRGQRGLRQKMMDALMRSGRYLPYMEKVFDEAGLPVLLTRLPFVESSFNNAAYSKSGAAGVWQFMPGSARMYMSYDEIGDQRRDPWFSTEAAAQHLRDDYETLQDWPLAVTAYNFGRNGIVRALAEINGQSLVDMIQRYEHPRWGFAGKNFYAEFLAAVDVEQNALKYFGPILREEPAAFDEFKTEHYVRFDTLRRLAGADPETFAELNPSFSTEVQQGHLYVPPGKRIRLPAGRGGAFAQSYARLGSSELFARQRSYFATHRVRSGDTLSGLAHRYRTSVSAIRQANGLSKNGVIRIGQNLKLPTGGGGASQALAAAPAAGPSFHVVRSGETLSGIADRYGVSLASLQSDNGIQKADSLRAGMRLKIEPKRPAVAFHTVAPGETLSSIARRYGVSIRSLQEGNDIARPDSLRVGARLKVAGAARRESVHVIRSGQTLESIARSYGLSVNAIASANNLTDVNSVRVGQRLTLPGS